MSLTRITQDKFATVFDKSDFQSGDPFVKLQRIQKGNNIIVGGKPIDGTHDGLVYIGKVIENTVGKNYLGGDIWLNTSFPHVIYITGTRGSGKSFDLGVLMEGIGTLGEKNAIQNARPDIATILIDTQSQFWTLAFPPNPEIPENQSQLEHLKEWNIKAGNLEKIRLLIPEVTDRIIGTEEVFYLAVDQVRHEEWCHLIREEVYSPQGHVLSKTLELLSKQSHYTIEDMINCIGDQDLWENVADSSRFAVIYKLDDYRRSGLFGAKGLNLQHILESGQTTVFMLRDLRDEDKSLVTSVIARQLFNLMGEHHKQLKVDRFFGRERPDENMPSRVWLLIDEAHVVAPNDSPSPARSSLIEYVKRGRDAGLSLVLATQQPSAVDTRILSQVNLALSHRLTFQNDIVAATNRIPTKLLKKLGFGGVELKEFGDMLRWLGAGRGLIGDHSTSRVILSQIRPRITSHGGYSPS